MRLKSLLLISILWISGWQQVRSQVPEWSRLLEVSPYGATALNFLDWDGTHLYQAIFFSGNMTYSGYELTSAGPRDVVISKTTSSGNTVWFTQFRGPDEYFSVGAMKGDPNGQLFVYGQYSGSITVGGIPVSGTNGFLAKLDGSGSVVWVTPLQTTNVSAGKIDFDAAGNIYLACQLNRLIKFSPQGTLIWEQTYPAGTLNDIAISGSRLFLGVTLPAGTGTYQFGSYSISANTRTGVVMKANLDGEILSHMEARGILSGISAVVRLKCKPDGQLLILGAYSRDLIFNDYTWASKTNGYYFYIAQCDTSLLVSWVTSSENTGLGYNAQTSQRLLTDNAGNFYLYGNPVQVQFGNIQVENTYFLMKFNPDGNPAGVVPLQNCTTAPVMEENGDYYVAGILDAQITGITNNIYLKKSDWSTQVKWQKNSTEVISGKARICYAKHDNLGNLYTSARVSGQCDYFGKQINTPVTQTLLSKMGQEGNLLWSVPVTDLQAYLNSPMGPQVAVDHAGNLITIGKFDNELELGSRFFLSNMDTNADGYVTKLSAAGEPLWVFHLQAGGGLYLNGTVIDSDGNTMVSGMYNGTVTVGEETLNAQGKSGVFLLKLTPEGQKVWVRNYTADRVASALPATAPDGSIYLACGMFNAAGFTFGEQEQLRIADEGGNILIKFSPDGQPLWARNYGRAVTDNANRQPISVKTDDSGNCYLYGICGNNSIWNGTTYTTPFTSAPQTIPQRFLAKISSTGEVLWTRMIFQKTSLISMGDLLDLDEKGNVYTGSHFRDSIMVAGNYFNPEYTDYFFISKFTESGELSWVKNFRSSFGYITSLSVLKENSLSICGYTVSTPAFGPFTTTNKGGTTTAIASLGGLWPHFVPVWSKNGVDQMNINIYSALLDGVDLAPGDEIGVFDGEICVGAGMVSETITSGKLLKIIVSGDDGSGNGYIPGHPITYRYYNKSAKKEIPLVTAVYNDSNPYWSTTGAFAVGATAFAALNGESMNMTTLSLEEGWNLVSTPVIPNEPGIDQVFSPLISGGKLVKVMDESGNTLENLGSYGGWNNAIGQLSLSEGYKVKVTGACQLGIQGAKADLPWSIPLTAGWNIIGFPYEGEVNAMNILQPLITRGHLIKVQDESGQSVEDFGEFGGWTNGIGIFRPGKGYKVKVGSEEVLTIEAAYPKSAVPAPSKIPTLHFHTAFKGNGTDHMNINLVGLPGNLFQPGDEIAVYDGENCVGAAVVLPYHIGAHLISIPASASDHSGQPGFTEGNPFILRLWKAASGEEMVLEPEILKGTRGFRRDESTFASLGKYATTGIAMTGKETQEIWVYPNPTTGKVFLTSPQTVSRTTGISVMNSTGQEIIRKSLDELPGEIDLSGYAPGIYYLRITSDSLNRTERITLQGK